MPPDSFVQRLVNYSTSCRLIRVDFDLTDGRRYDVALIARRRADSLTRGKPRPMSRRGHSPWHGPCSRQEKTMTKFALYVPLQAKPGKEKEVADFLRSAVPLVDAEPGTISWFAIQEGPSSFAIFDTFDDEAGRDAHLNGKVAAALMEKAKAGDLFAKTPEIHKLGILADKLPK
jgi:quinol monooxygenase YgiN